MNAMRLEDMINANYTHLNENDHEIWKFIKENRELCEHLSIDDLALRVMFLVLQYYVLRNVLD